LKDVREELQEVKKTTLEVKADAEKTARWISNWALDMLPVGPWGISWPLLVVTPILNVVLVGYGIPASYTRNIGLAIIGKSETVYSPMQKLIGYRYFSSKTLDPCYTWAVERECDDSVIPLTIGPKQTLTINSHYSSRIRSG
jgi:hypothetical protein